MITVTAAAPNQNLVALADVKLLLGIDDASKDAVLTLLIGQVSAEIATWCGRVFGRETVTETIPGSGRTRMLLTRRPVISVAAVRFDGAALAASGDWSLEDPDRGYLLRLGRWYEERYASGPTGTATSPEVGRALYAVDYVGGYWLPGWAGSPGAGDRRLPVGLSRIATDLVISRFRQIGRDRDVQSYSLGDYSVQFRSFGNSMSLEIERELAPYRSLL